MYIGGLIDLEIVPIICMSESKVIVFSCRYYYPHPVHIIPSLAPSFVGASRASVGEIHCPLIILTTESGKDAS